MDSQAETLVLAPRPIEKTQKSPLSLEPQDRLTKKQKLFVEYYLRGMSPHKAALTAGYSPFTAEVAHSVILGSPLVASEIRRRSRERFKDLEIDTDWVIEEAAKLASANMFDYIEVGEDGTFKVNLNRCTREMGAAIQELSYDPEGRPKIRLADKKASVELLARIKKMFNDDVRDEKGAGDKVTIQSLDQIIQNVTINQQFVGTPQPRHQLVDTPTQ